MRVLLCGESWVTHSLHIKGVDSFTTSSCVEGADHLRAVLAGGGIEVDYLPGHLVPARFPATAGDLAGYTAVILSDIGANSILLAPQTFERSEPAPDRLAAIEEYVRAGGGLLMVGGYLSFAGIEGKARYHGTPVESVLPVLIAEVDDRVEAPQGVVPVPAEPRPPGAGRRAGPVARGARLQPGDTAPGGRGGGALRRRPARDLRRVPRRPQRGVHLRLRPALGPARLHGLARLSHPVAQPDPLAGRAQLGFVPRALGCSSGR